MYQTIGSVARANRVRGPIMALELAVQEFLRSAAWLLDVLRRHQPLTEQEARTLDAKFRTLMIEWDTWKRWKEEEQQKKKPKRAK
jgi:hypothetical protein